MKTPVLILLLLVAISASGETVYQGHFAFTPPPDHPPLTNVGWQAHRTSAAIPSDSAYLSHSSDSSESENGFALADGTMPSGICLFWTDALIINRNRYRIDALQSYLLTSTTVMSNYFAVRLGTNWYISVAFNAVQSWGNYVLAFTRASNQWRQLQFVTNSFLSIGGSPTNDLSEYEDLTGVGILVGDKFGGHFFATDNFCVYATRWIDVSTPSPERVTFTWASTNQGRYRTQFSTNLPNYIWTDFGPTRTGLAVSTSIIETNPVESVKFFRVRYDN